MQGVVEALNSVIAASIAAQLVGIYDDEAIC
jgi:hypothetical protein